MFLITGASGFVGGHCVEAFLKDGHSVRGTVRDPASETAKFLLELAAKYPLASLELVAADLLDAEAISKAVEGCDVVVHTASPVTEDVKDPQTELVDPAVNGTRNVVQACIAHGVKRLVVTSSVAVLEGDWTRAEPYTEECNNEKCSLKYGPYAFSKVQAEKVLVELWGDRPLVTIHPSLVLGPQQNPRVTSSNQLLRAVFNREYPLLMPFVFSFIDVRDVARAHLLAAVNESASGRYICSQPGNRYMKEIATITKAHAPESRPPTYTMPYWALYSVSFLDRRLSQYMLDALCKPHATFDGTKLERELGFSYLYSFDQSIKDSYDSFKEQKITK